MKKLFVTAMIVLKITTINAQGLNNPQQGPEFKGGTKALNTYMEKNLVYPDLARRQGLEGNVKLNLFIRPDGKVGSEIKIVKSLGSGLDTEAIRLVKNMPDWKPAIKNERPVGARYQLSIYFELD